MIRKGLLVSALAGALVGFTPAQASVQFSAISNIVDQLHNNSSFNPTDMSFTICQNGSCQTLFTGLSGLHNYTDLSGFNSWAGTGNLPSGGGYFDNYKPTFTGVTTFFGNSQPQGYTYQVSAPTPPPIPEPATWALMIMGFGVIGAAMRRRKAVAVSFG
jgi:hypothetical protein